MGHNDDIIGGHDLSDFAYFSDAQYIVLFSIGMISSLLSMAGSGIILSLVIRGKRTGELYQRLLFGLSLSDLLMTCTLILQPVLVPKSTDYFFAVGNDATCAFLGFGYLFFVASYGYNCMLGIYFLAVVRYRVPEKNIARFMEPAGHILAFGMPIGIGSAALRNDMLNPNPFLGVCSLFPARHECTWQDDVECENASAWDTLNSLLDFYALGLVGLGLICTVGVYWTVRRRYRSRLRPETPGVTDQVQEAQIQRTRSVARQAILYACAFMVGLLVVLAANIVGGIIIEDSLDSLGDSGLYFAITFLIWFFFPLQGFLNCLIYINPRLIRWKSYYEDQSWWFAFRQVLSGEAPPRWGQSLYTTEHSLVNTGNRDMSSTMSDKNTKQGAGYQEARSREQSWDRATTRDEFPTCNSEVSQEAVAGDQRNSHKFLENGEVVQEAGIQLEQPYEQQGEKSSWNRISEMSDDDGKTSTERDEDTVEQRLPATSAAMNRPLKRDTANSEDVEDTLVHAEAALESPVRCMSNRKNLAQVSDLDDS